MPGLEEELTHKVGPIPVWSYGVLMAAAFIGFVVWRNKRKANANAQAQDAATGTGEVAPTDSTGGTDAGFPGGPIQDFLAQNPTSSAYPVGLPVQGLPGPVTNEQWARLSADELIAKGSVPTEVETALSRFLNGNPLSAVDKAIVDLALQFFGSPPEGVIPVTNVVPITPPTTPPLGSRPPPKFSPLPAPSASQKANYGWFYAGKLTPVSTILAHYGLTLEQFQWMNPNFHANSVRPGNVVRVRPNAGVFNASTYGHKAVI